MSRYDAIARLYDPWSVSVTEDVPFYVDEARRVSPGPVVELGVGTGRITVPIAVMVVLDAGLNFCALCFVRAQLDQRGILRRA